MVCMINLVIYSKHQCIHEVLLLIPCYFVPTYNLLQLGAFHSVLCFFQCHVEARVQKEQVNRTGQDKRRIMDENVKPLQENITGSGDPSDRFGALVCRILNFVGTCS